MADLFSLYVAPKELLQLIDPIGICGKCAFQRDLNSLTRVDHVRVDREASVLLGEARRELRKAEVVTDDIEEIGGVGAIEDVAARVQAHRFRMQPQQPIRD